MIAVTTEELERAEAEAEQARRDLGEAERAYASHRSSVEAYNRHQNAIERAEHAAVRARVLRADWESQQAVRDARAAAGEAAARDMADVVEGLVQSRAAAVAAVVKAEAAMRVALITLAEHDRLVRAAGEALTARGLLSREGEPTGVDLDGSAWVGGVHWPLVDGAGVLGHCLAGQVAALYPRHPLARPVAAPYGGVSAARGRDEVLALVWAERGR